MPFGFKCRRILFCLALILFCATAVGKPLSLKIIPVGDSVFFIKHFSYNHTYNSDKERDKILDKLLLDLYGQSYLAANFGELKKDSTGSAYILHTGKPFHWAKLKQGNIDEGWLSFAGYREKLYLGQVFNYTQVRSLLEKLLSYAENNGYPFAQVRLRNINIGQNEMTAELHINKNKKVEWDSIEVVGDGDTAINRDFLRAYLGIFPGKPYSEKLARQIKNRLREVLYIRITADPQIVFTGNKAKTRIFIEEQKANRLDGVLGLAPNSTNNNKFLLTGEFNLALLNVLGEGVGLTLGYKSFLQSAQQINVGIQYPYILGLPIGVTEDFNLAKFDTSYYLLDNKIGLNYYLSGKDYFRVIYNNNSSHLLNASAYAHEHSLPPVLDVSTDWYGVALHLENLDFKYNPHQGYSLHIEASTGVKSIIKNPSLDASLYDSLHLKKLVYRVTSDASLFIPLTLHSTINLGMLTAMLADNETTLNQLFRIGGLHDLRGFDEQSIYASTYYIPRIEYRYLIDKNSNFQVFYNAAYYQEFTRTRHKHDVPMGIGTGYNYLIKNGLFSISFAVGKQMSGSFDFNAAKVHIGYLNRF
jgi:outer membrane protein assembly factor BamA